MLSRSLLRLTAALPCAAPPASRSHSFASSKDFIALEDKYGAHNYAPLPVVIAHGKGATVTDVEGKQYLDFLAAYSAVNQGHCHPRIVAAAKEQMETLTLTSRAFHNNLLGPFEKYLHELFGYDRSLMMNSGVEGGETAVKLCRKWGYLSKGIPENKARVVFATQNFWGRSIAALSSSSDENCFKDFGPYTPGFSLIPYNDVAALEEIAKDPHTAAFYVEPIQGEAGVVVPDDGYLREVRRICSENNVLWVADEVQSGLGRTGKMLAVEHEGVRPDMVVLGKALSGGVMPVSAVLADDPVMMLLKPGQHGSTYGGNPLACAVAKAALDVLVDEKLCERSSRLGEHFRSAMSAMPHGWVRDVRGRGLFNAIEIDPEHKVSAYEICLGMADRGLIAKQTHENVIRFAPPLVISDEELDEGCGIITDAFAAADK